jgi:tetratricopeptide (TPR) repeat protein
MRHDVAFSRRHFFLVLTTMILAMASAPIATAGVPSPGGAVPAFRLSTLEGGQFDLAAVKERPLTVLYFFSPAAAASRHGMELLGDLNRRYGATDIGVVAVAVGTRESVKRWVAQPAPGVTVLVDDGHVSRLYEVGQVLPVAYLIGPELQMLNQVVGGGKGGHKFLVRLAERQLGRRKIHVARSLASEAVRQAPEDTDAKAVLGYAALKEGKIDEAGKIFEELEAMPAPVKAVGQEGLAQVRLRQGATEQALSLARKAAGRAGSDVLQGDVLLSRGDFSEAEAVYRQAVDSPGFTFQQAAPYSRLGQLAARGNNFPEAQRYYDQGLRVDPYAVELLSNKGVSFAREGRWDEARAAYRKVLDLDPKDQMVLGLLRQAEELADLSRDAQRAERVDRLVKELAECYRTGKCRSKDEDEWTSRPLVLAFLPLEEMGLLGDRDGLAEAITLEIGENLKPSGRVRVVERVILDKLLEELKLGSSELADRDVRLKLGRVLAARVLAAGTLKLGAGEAQLNLRLIDNETTAIASLHKASVRPEGLSEAASLVAGEVVTSLRKGYPLQGYIVEVEGKDVIINLGSDHGVRANLRLEILAEGKPIRYKGKMLKRDLVSVGGLVVTRVEPGLSHARVLESPPSLKKDLRVRELVEEGETL